MSCEQDTANPGPAVTKAVNYLRDAVAVKLPEGEIVRRAKLVVDASFSFAPANPAQVTDEQIVEIAVAHSNYKDGGEFEVFSHKRIVEFARHLMALSAAIGAGRSPEPEFETAPDNGTPAEVLAYVLECARRWVPEARIIGNARAGDIERAIAAVGAGNEQPFHLVEEFDDVGAQMVVAPAIGADGQAAVELPADAAPLSGLTWKGDPSSWMNFWRKRDGEWVSFEGRMHPNGEIEYRNGKRSRHNTASHVSPLSQPHPISQPHPADERVVEALREAGCTTEDGTYVHAPMKEVVAALSGSSAGAGGSVQTGWRLVPEEPTEAMITAGKDAYRRARELGDPNAHGMALLFYRAMLPAAPQPKGE